MAATEAVLANSVLYGFLPAALDLERSAKEFRAEVHTRLARVKAELREDADRQMAESLEMSRAFIASPDDLDDAGWDQILSEAEATQAALEREMAAIDAILGRVERLASMISDEHGRIVAAARRAAVEAMKQYLATVQDIRWNTIATRAEKRRFEHGPIFEDPADLDGYLSDLKS